MVNIINQSQADLIVFCGHTLKDKNDLCVGNQGKMEKRRELLSANNRYYLSVSQNGTKSRKDNKYLISMNSRSLQYSFYNGFAFMEIDNESTNDYQKRLFEL
ncbi:MAG: hypothetical protein J5708_06665 [Bacteroidales bacterium]|nr:hypothetical protein [Bacteroidales bacterium]